MKYLRYYSAFKSIGKVDWRIEIYQESDSIPIPERVEMTDEPLEIEWSETDKFDPIQSSCATINLISMDDRQFVDLYSINPENVRLDVYRNNSLYWSGLIDPELYEEPYSYRDRYVVSITFSDFAILERLDWQRKGFGTIEEFVRECLNATKFTYTKVNKYISTKLNEQYLGSLFDDCTLVGDNFFDEEDEPMTMREVLEGILQPFALKIIQKNGQVYIYDLNYLIGFAPSVVEWRGTDATLGTDSVYNNVTVTYSPYEQDKLMNIEVDEKDFPTPETGAIRVYTDNHSLDSEAVGFDIYLGEKGVGTKDFDINTNFAALYNIQPTYSGSEERGVAWCVHPLNTQYLTPAYGVAGYTPHGLPTITPTSIIKPKSKVYIGIDNAANYRLNVSLELLFDVRYNPFESASVPNEEGNWGRLQNWCNFAYVPFALRLYDSAGNMIMRYNNINVMESNGWTTKGQWENSSQKTGISGFLAYYNLSDRKTQSGLGGWQTNKPAIGYYRKEFPALIGKLGDGDCIPLPPVPGMLELEIFAGVHQFDYGRDSGNIYAYTRWVLYKNPKITIVDNYGNDLKLEDVETSAWINKQAKEKYEISTIIGTRKDPLPTGRGYILNTSSKSAYRTFYRAGVQDSLERLLIGTVYSNHSRRANVLSGTTKLQPAFCSMYDKSDVDSKYVVLSEIQHPADDTSEVKLVRLFEDNFEGIEYETEI